MTTVIVVGRGRVPAADPQPGAELRSIGLIVYTCLCEGVEPDELKPASDP